MEQLSREAMQAYAESDREQAKKLAQRGKAVSRSCDELLSAIALSDFPTAVAVNTTIATRYYKRIAGHLLNLLSSVVMPLHKLDYIDESLFPETTD